MLNILNASIISENDVAGDFPAFGPTDPPPGTSMSGDHPAGCTTCSTICMGSCSGDCMGGCGDANCEGQCTLECASSCSENCTSTCGSDCTGGCGDTCLSSCKESCQGGCSGGCEGCTGCAGGCIDSCANGCKHSCISMATTSGTHTFTPDWPESWTEDMQHIDTDMLIDILNVIKDSIDKIAKYDYRRISELDEAVLVHDADTLAGAIIHTAAESTGTTVEDVGEIDLQDLNLVVSDFDNRTVRITAAALVDFVEKNYRNYWVWLPKIEEGSGGSYTKLTWEFTNDTHPGEIDLTDVLADGIDKAIEDELAKKDLIARSFITGLDPEGDPVPLGAHVLRLANAAGINPADVVNSSFLDDLDARYAAHGAYLSPEDAEATYETKAHASNTYETSAHASDTYETQANHTADVTNMQAAINNKLDSSTAANTYETKSHASSTYETSAHASDTYLTKSDASNTYATKGEVPTQVADDTHNGLMGSSHVVALTTATSDITNIKNTLNGLPSDFSNFITDSDYAYIDNLHVAHPGIVAILNNSALSVGANGVIDLKDYTVNNLIRNSIFEDGFDSNWTGDLDTTLTSIYTDSTLGKSMARVAIEADGVLTQSFKSDAVNGFTVGILFKQDPSVAKTIEVKIDSEAYSSFTISSGNNYVLGEFYFDIADASTIGTHTLSIHNPDTSNTVSYDFTEIMVQKGRQFTGWNRNDYDVASTKSVTIISYDNNITFKDAAETYLNDVYDETETIIIHHAGDAIDPSSSIIMHKDKQYFYAHITALHEIDGQIRQDVIPLRINLITGKCDISGNAVTAGTLIDNTGELVPTVAEINAFMDGSALSITDQLTGYVEVTVMPEPSVEIMHIPYLYMGESIGQFEHGEMYYVDGDDPHYLEWYPMMSPYDTSLKYKYVINKTVDNVTTELASVPHVGRFCDDNNNEIFNDYYANKIFSGTHCHIEGSQNTVYGSDVHAEGTNNTVGTATTVANYMHIEGRINKYYRGTDSHIEGSHNTVYGSYVHAEGDTNIVGTTTAVANNVHIEGRINKAYRADVHVEGLGNTAYGQYVHAEGNANTVGTSSAAANNVHVEGHNNKSYKAESHVEGYNNTVYGEYSHVEGDSHTVGTSTINAQKSHIEGATNTVYGSYVHAEGNTNIVGTTTAVADNVHIEGRGNESYKPDSHVEGYHNTVYGVYSHVEGSANYVGTDVTSASNYHVEGQSNYVYGGSCNHVEGASNSVGCIMLPHESMVLSTQYNHVEGYGNAVFGSYLHVEGRNNNIGNYNAPLYNTHVEGFDNTLHIRQEISISSGHTTSSGNNHVEGTGNRSNSFFAHVAGYYNQNDSAYATVVGLYNNRVVGDGGISLPLDNGTTMESGYLNEQGLIVPISHYYTTDYIEMPYIPSIFNVEFGIFGSENSNAGIHFYDKDKHWLLSITKRQCDNLGRNLIYLDTYVSQISTAKYVRFSAFELAQNISNYAVIFRNEAHLFEVGNGYHGDIQSSEIYNRTVYSNIFEVGYDRININGEIYQNGEPFVDTTLNTTRSNPIANSTVATALNTKTTQLATMPTAAATYEDQIVQFIGTTDANYTNGFFYKCVSNSGSYSWQNVAVSEYPPVATSSADGLMSSSMFTKLNGITTASANNEGLMPAAMYTKLNNIGLATTSDIDNIFS